MALAADGSVDTRKLQKEMVTALAEDIKYVKTDEMKKRAIKTARSYDEFKGMVACACLTPVSREDIDSLSKTKKGWVSTVTTKGKAPTSVRRTQKAGASGKALGVSKGAKAKSSMEFEREWRRMGKDPQERYRYLCSVGVSGLLEMFVSEMDASLMGDVIETLHATYTHMKETASYTQKKAEEGLAGQGEKENGPAQPEQPAEGGEGEKGLTEGAVRELWGLLSCLPQTGRFNLTFRFLSTQQRAKAMSLIAELGAQGSRGQGVGDEEVQALAEAFSKVQ